MSEPTYRVERIASEYERIAERRAAELIEQLGVPVVYDEALNLVALAYLEGGRDQLKWARDQLRGDGE